MSMFPRAKILPIAEQIVKKLQPHCQVVFVAGSLRREKLEVKDMELVVIPKRDTIGAVDLFGEGAVEEIVVPGFVSALRELGKVIKGQPSGKMMQIEIPIGVNDKIILDLFMPDWWDTYRTLAIRTGSKEYSHNVIAKGWLQRGWCGSDMGLRKQDDCMPTKGPDGKMKWKCINFKAEKPPVWSDEKDFFEWIGVQWIHPKYRNF